jgi:hypothetical protein
VAGVLNITKRRGGITSALPRPRTGARFNSLIPCSNSAGSLIAANYFPVAVI